jgi:dihydropteroate synthase
LAAIGIGDEILHPVIFRGVRQIKGIIIDRDAAAAGIERQMTEIGVDPRGIEIMTDKFEWYTIRVYQVSFRQAAIIKQEMLAQGADAAVSWQVCSWDRAGSESPHSLLLAGTLRQLRRFIAKLKQQPFGLPELAVRIETGLANYRQSQPLPTMINGQAYDLFAKTYVMGIINVTPDSFSKDGLLNKQDYIEAALRQAERMIAEGADFLDVGAESTRPGATKVDPAEEEKRLLPVIKELAASFGVPISVDTYKPEVAAKAIGLGASIINDQWGLRWPEDPEQRMAKVAGESGAPVIVMHNRTQPGYTDLIREAIDWLDGSIEIAQKNGVKAGQIIVDPGIGFGKTYQDNLQILANLEKFKVLGLPILLGTSRKSVIGLTLDLPVEERLEGTLAAVVWGLAHGVNIVRVHDVQSISRAVRMGDAIKSNR